MTAGRLLLPVVLALTGCDQLFAIRHIDQPPPVDAPIDMAPDMTVCTPRITDYSVGANPYSIAIADIDGKNGPDLLVPGAGVNAISVLLNQGDGTFTAAPSEPTGGNPTHVAVADMTNDGQLDLVVTTFVGGTVEIHVGAGDGTFTLARTLSFGGNPISVAVGALDGDALQDFAVALQAGNVIQPMLQTATDWVYGNGLAVSSPQDVALADLDSNGSLDIAAVSSNTATMALFFGDGAGSFQAASPILVGGKPTSIAIGRINGDAVPDVAVGSAGGQRIDVLLGDGNGAFASSIMLPVNAEVWSVALGDLDTDGKVDVAAAQYTAPQGVRIYPGDGAGGFGMPIDRMGHGAGEWIAIADLDGTAPNDYVVANWDHATITVTLGCPP